MKKRKPKISKKQVEDYAKRTFKTVKVKEKAKPVFLTIEEQRPPVEIKPEVQPTLLSVEEQMLKNQEERALKAKELYENILYKNKTIYNGKFIKRNYTPNVPINKPVVIPTEKKQNFWEILVQKLSTYRKDELITNRELISFFGKAHTINIYNYKFRLIECGYLKKITDKTFTLEKEILPYLKISHLVKKNGQVGIDEEFENKLKKIWDEKGV